MVAKLTRGHTYSPSSEVNAANLMNLISNATMAGLDRSNIDRTIANCVTEVENISQAELREPVIDSQTGWMNTRVVSGGSLVPATCVPTAFSYQLFSGSESVDSGELLYSQSVDGITLIMRKSTLANAHKAMAISSTSTDPGGFGVCIMNGICKAMTDGGAFSPGDSVFPSTTDIGKITSNGAGGIGIGKIGVCLAVDGSSVWINLFR